MTSSSLKFSLFSIYLTEKGFLRQCYMFWECLYPTRSAHFPPSPGSSIRIPFPICFVESCDGEFVTRVVTMWPLSSSSTLSRMTTRSGGRVWEVEPSSRSRATGRLLTSSLPDVTLRVVSTTSVGITWTRFGDSSSRSTCKSSRFLDVTTCKGELFTVWTSTPEGRVAKFVSDSRECTKTPDNTVLVCACPTDSSFCWSRIITRSSGRVAGEGLRVESSARPPVSWSERTGMFSPESSWGWTVWGMMMLSAWKSLWTVGGAVVVGWGEAFGL